MPVLIISPHPVENASLLAEEEAKLSVFEARSG
jgi:hypothetical protein